MTSQFALTSQDVDKRIRMLETRISGGEALDPQATTAEALALAVALMRAHRTDRLAVDEAAIDRFAALAASDDPLDVFVAFVKGEPTLNAIRDNVRELVFYRNCLARGRPDALPPKVAVMAVRTIRHIYLYLCSRMSHTRPGPNGQ